MKSPGCTARPCPSIREPSAAEPGYRCNFRMQPALGANSAVPPARLPTTSHFANPGAVVSLTKGSIGMFTRMNSLATHHDRRLQDRPRQYLGFTLVEMMVVVCIVAILL